MRNSFLLGHSTGREVAGSKGGGTTTDDRRPTTDDRRPTTDDRRPTTDDRRPTTEQSVEDGRLLAELG
jgi:hypothetical protein